MAEKDSWDKFDIIMKVVILGLIPIFIKLGADSITQSLETEKLVYTSIVSLVDTNNTKRDISLIALDYAIPEKETCYLVFKCQKEPKRDEVVDIATTLLHDALTKSLDMNQTPEIRAIAHIITKRTSEQFYIDTSSLFIKESQKSAITNSNESPSPQQIDNKEKLDAKIAAMQPTIEPNNVEFKGIRLVYIQYAANKSRAEEVKTYLQGKINKSAAPGTEQVTDIKENSIRYANPADKTIAKNLQLALKQDLKIDVSDDNLKDLEKAHYKVPSGQLEIWLKE